MESSQSWLAVAARPDIVTRAIKVGIVVGTRYIHTVTEMIHKTDLQAALDILTEYLAMQD